MDGQSFLPRKHRRRWIAFAVMLCMLASGWLVWRWMNPRLVPITERHFTREEFKYSPYGFRVEFKYSAHGFGYPVAQTILYVPKLGGVVYLNERGNPRPNKEFTALGNSEYEMISPTRKVLAWSYTDPKTEKPWLIRGWEDGRITKTTGFTGGADPVLVTDSGLICADGGVPRYQTAEGKLITLSLPSPATDWKFVSNAQSLDADLLPLRRDADASLYIYDIARKSIIVKFSGYYSYTGPNPSGYTTIILRQGERIAAIPYQGRAMVWDGKTMSTRPPKSDYEWHLGEDGTVWTYYASGPQLLKWRSGSRPFLVPLPYQDKFDGKIMSYQHGIAVWGDGQLIVHAELRRDSSEEIDYILDRVYALLKEPRPPARDRLWLALYRSGRLVGRYSVPVQPLGPGYQRQFSEHMAFTADGRYLACNFYTGDGSHFYVFPTSQ